MELLGNKSYQTLIAACILKIGSAGITLWKLKYLFLFIFT